MQYPFPDEFPEKSRRTLLAEEIRGATDLEKAQKESAVSKSQELLIGFILRGAEQTLDVRSYYPIS